MASILDRYGIKEVADLTFYKIDKDHPDRPGTPVLYIDTAKVSTIEQTAESTSARGGKGNPELIMWDYGKEITLNIEDALFSQKSMALMFGTEPQTSSDTTVYRVFTPVEMHYTTGETANITINGTSYNVRVSDIELYGNGSGFIGISGSEEPITTTATIKELLANKHYDYGRFAINASTKTQITINSDTFPDTYYVTGDTYVRSETTGEDEFFQFIVPKAKMQSEVTLTMEAEGDPTTFTMNMKVLRPADKQMIKLVQYSLPTNDNISGSSVESYGVTYTLPVGVKSTLKGNGADPSGLTGAFEDEIDLGSGNTFGDDTGDYSLTITMNGTELTDIQNEEFVTILYGNRKAKIKVPNVTGDITVTVALLGQ